MHLPPDLRVKASWGADHRPVVITESRDMGYNRGPRRRCVMPFQETRAVDERRRFIDDALNRPEFVGGLVT